MCEPFASAREISVDEFDEMIENHDDMVIVDVREAHDYHRGHIPGALPVPHGILDDALDVTSRQRLDRLIGARGKTLVICSQDGSRCAEAANKLQQMGFEKVYCLVGGVERWQQEGFALVTE